MENIYLVVGLIGCFVYTGFGSILHFQRWEQFQIRRAVDGPFQQEDQGKSKIQGFERQS